MSDEHKFSVEQLRPNFQEFASPGDMLLTDKNSRGALIINVTAIKALLGNSDTAPDSTKLILNVPVAGTGGGRAGHTGNIDVARIEVTEDIVTVAKMRKEALEQVRAAGMHSTP